MDTLLILLGILGFGAVMVAVHVFVDGSRSYEFDSAGVPDKEAWAEFTERSPVDRRRGDPVEFPLAVSGVLIQQDRRIVPVRRLAVA
jgi:hypothetical protein